MKVEVGPRMKAKGGRLKATPLNPKSKIKNSFGRRQRGYAPLCPAALERGYEVHEAGDGEAALAVARENPPDLVLADVMMDGFGLLHALRGDLRTRSIPVILMAEHGGEVWRREVLEAGANDCLIKPFSGGELRARVSARLEIALLHREALEREHKLCGGRAGKRPEIFSARANAQAHVAHLRVSHGAGYRQRPGDVGKRRLEDPPAESRRGAAPGGQSRAARFVASY